MIKAILEVRFQTSPFYNFINCYYTGLKKIIDGDGITALANYYESEYLVTRMFSNYQNFDLLTLLKFCNI